MERINTKKFENLSEFYNSLDIGSIGIIFSENNDNDAKRTRIILFIVLSKTEENNLVGIDYMTFSVKYKRSAPTHSYFSSTSYDSNSYIIWKENNQLTYGYKEDNSEFFLVENNEATNEFFSQMLGSLGFCDQLENFHQYIMDFLKDQLGKLIVT